MAKNGSSTIVKTLKDKQFLIMGVLGLMLLVVVLGPVSNKLRERIATEKKLTKDFNQLNIKMNVLGGIDSILIDERVKQMEKVFPSQKPVVQLLGSLSQLSGQHGLSFGGVSLNPGNLGEEVEKEQQKTVSPTDLQDLKFGFEVGGDFIDILAFMKSLENAAPLMKIENVSLSIKTNPLFEKESTLVVAEIEVAAFFQPPPKTLGSVSKPVELLSREDEKVLDQLVNFRTFEAVFPVAPTGKADLFGLGP